MEAQPQVRAKRAEQRRPKGRMRAAFVYVCVRNGNVGALQPCKGLSQLGAPYVTRSTLAGESMALRYVAVCCFFNLCVWGGLV